MTTEKIQFIQQGFIRIDNAFPPELAAAGREILWRDTACDPNNPATWTKPVIRLWDYPQAPFRDAVNTPILHTAYDALVGPGNWQRRESLGTFPIRFPSPDDPGDTGWHADASFAGPDGSWRLNFKSAGRALLMLFLFSDIGEDDAPTRIRIGSHLRIPRLLLPHGDDGLSFLELGALLDESTADLPETLATGPAGTVYLCHPFLIHAAQPHRGKQPRFMAQPPLYPARDVYGSGSPVDAAIQIGLSPK